MKIKYILACLFASIGIANAQYQNYDLKTPDTAPETYIGRDYVRFLPGYTFKASTGTYMDAKIQAGLSTTDAGTFLSAANPTGDTSITPDQLTAINTTSMAVGQIPISSSVSPSGAKCYNVPIDIVPGRLGFQPNISLSYNSQDGNGLVGMGWSISGLSSIERVNKNVFFDGANDITTLSANDAFELDGTRLIKNSATSTVSQFNYETVQGNTKVIAYVNGDIVQYFKVFYPNGTIGIFGYNTNTNPMLSYPITLLTDLNGSTITFTYDSTDDVDLNSGHTNEVNYIKEIDYGGIPSKADDFAKMKFTFDTTLRPDMIVSLQSTKSCIYRKRLSKIETFGKTDNDLIRTYQFQYSNSDPRIASNLKDVTRLSQIDCFVPTINGNSYLNPLKFYYGDSKSLSVNTKGTGLTWDDLVNKNFIRGKFDTDIQSDALLTYPKGDIYKLLTIGYTTFNTTCYPSNNVLTTYHNLNTGTAVAQPPISAEQGFLGVVSADIDGTSHDRIVKINSNTSNGIEKLKFKIYGTDTSIPLREEVLNFGALNYSGTTYILPKEFYTGNFSGAGVTEIACILKNSNGTPITIVNLQSGIKPIYATSFTRSEKDMIYPMDIDGDGQTELVQVTSTQTNLYKYTSKSGFVNVGTWALKLTDFNERHIYFNDLNGDGKMDVVMSPKAPQVNSWEAQNFDPGAVVKCPNCGKPIAFTTDHMKQTIVCSCHTSVKGPYIFPSDSPTLKSTCVICGTAINNCDVGCLYHHKFQADYKYTFEQVDTYDKTWKYFFTDGNYKQIEKDQVLFQVDALHDYFIQDIDGDNIPELIVNSNTIYPSGTVTFYPFSNNDLSFTNTPFATSYTMTIHSNIIPVDMNSMNKSPEMMIVDYYNSEIQLISLSENHTKSNLMSLMINSFGIADKTNYDQLYQGTNYTPGTTAAFPYTDFQGSQWVTTGTSAMYNKQLISNTTYNYTGAILHNQGLGLRGFTSINSTDLMTNKGVATVFDPYKMGSIISQTSDKGESTFNYSFTDYNSSLGNYKMKLLLNSKTVTDKLKGNTVTDTYSNYDDYGNAWSSKTEFSGDIVINSTVENRYNNIVNDNVYLIGLLTNRKTTTKRDIKTFIQNDSYEYYDDTNKDRLHFIHKSIYKDPLTMLPISDTEYTYDPSYGVLTSETVQNVPTKDYLTTTYKYKPDDQCSLWTKKDPFGLTTTYSYDFDKRLLSTVTDYLGKTVTYGYDDWRRKNSETRPDGTATSITWNWNADSEMKRIIAETKISTGQPACTSYCDAFGRETRKAVNGFDGTNVYADKNYDNFGHLKSSSAPYNAGTTQLLTQYSYDDNDQLLTVVQPSGSTTNYTYTGNSIKENKDGVSTTKTTDATGILVSSQDAGGTVNYTYRADGQPDNINAAGVTTSFEYNDPYNRQTKLNDPSAGPVQTAYDDANHTVTQTWNSGKTITTVSNKFGQPSSRITPDFTTAYGYLNGQPASVSSTNGSSKLLTYDTFGRLWQLDEKVNGKTYEEVYAYDQGHISSITYNANTGTNTLSFPVIYKYNTNGYLYRLEDASGNRLREVNSVNALGMETDVLLGNGLTTTKNYTPEGLWTNVETLNKTNNNIIQNMSFNFNRINGTLNSRTDNMHGVLTENFTYDGLYRLKTYGSKTMDYNPNGNIINKMDVGGYTYPDNSKPYTLSTVTNATSDLTGQLNIVYTVMSRPVSISKPSGPSTLAISYQYNDDYDRSIMNLSYFSQIVQSKYYFGGGKYEIETSGTETQRLYLDGSPYTASILLEKIGSASLQTYYLHRDYLGSITHISDNSGNLAAEYSYDAWGRMRNPLNWDVYAQGSQPAMPHGERGYTGHEQLNQFGLINMNARLYDPLLARFLAPDPQVGNPETSNGFNRYMYASDNPMMFVDLNGEDGDHPYDGYTGGSWNGSGGSGSGQNSSGYNQNTGSSNSSGGFYSPGSGYTGGAYQDLSSGFGGYSAGNSDSGLGGFIIGVFESLYNLFSGGGSGHSSPPRPAMKLSSHPIIKTHGAFPASIGSSGGGNRRGNRRESSIQWISQYDPSVPNSGPFACKRACYMMDPFALRGMSNGYFVGKELGHSFITTNQTIKGYKYLNQQLLQNRPVIVGVGRNLAGYWGKNKNGDFTTDHFVVIDNPTNGGYHFLDPGSHYEESGASPKNIFQLGSDDLYTGKSYGAPLTITWIGWNK